MGPWPDHCGRATNAAMRTGILNTISTHVTLTVQLPTAMRILTFPLMLAVLPALATGPEKFFVVIHAQDKVVTQYVCTRSHLSGEDLVVRTKVTQQGSFNWHVVGGTAPYTVVKDQRTGPEGCITIMDATGQTTTACTSWGTRTEAVMIDCPWDRPDTLTTGLVPDRSTDAQHIRANEQGARPGGQYVPPVKTGQVEMPDLPHDPRKPGERTLKQRERVTPPRPPVRPRRAPENRMASPSMGNTSAGKENGGQAPSRQGRSTTAPAKLQPTSIP